MKQFVLSPPAMSLGDWFTISVSRKGGTGGGGLQLESSSRQVLGSGDSNNMSVL